MPPLGCDAISTLRITPPFLFTIYRQHLCNKRVINNKPLNIHLIAHPFVIVPTGIIAAGGCLWKAIPCGVVVLGQHLCARLALVLLAGNK
jgi:hypothetical protein